ncbi:MAG TPA: hypothetical protein VHD87_12880 [Acidimicrobiales bacterium]|nr:hypothetical protein [Acidimicrobiales bacterium]
MTARRCGAPTSQGPCQHAVSGGGPCWQHRAGRGRDVGVPTAASAGAAPPLPATTPSWLDTAGSPSGDEPSDDTWVYDSSEQRAWGPFATTEDADAFIESDKYLASWAMVVDGSDPALSSADRYQPEVYFA